MIFICIFMNSLEICIVYDILKIIDIIYFCILPMKALFEKWTISMVYIKYFSFVSYK